MPEKPRQESLETRAYRRAVERAETREKQQLEEDRVATMARAEVDKRFMGWLWLIAFIVLGAWQGWLGLAVWILAFVAVAAYEKWIKDRMPGAGADSAEHDAEDYVRHCILADLHEDGELQWKIEDGGVVVSHHAEWESLWVRLDQVVDEFLKASPEFRNKRIAEAKRRSLPARREMTEFARKHGATPLWWAQPDR